MNNEKKNIYMKNNSKLVLSLVAAGVFSSGLIGQKASAIPINGEVSFSGSYTVNNPNLVTASAFTGFSGVTVAAAPTGDYAGTAGTAATFTPFSWDAFVAVAPAWTFTIGPTTYSFDYSTLSIFANSPTILVLEGTGLAHITGFDDTPGVWNITANTFGTTFSFSSSAAVPDGGLTVALLGFALMGLEGLRRKLNK